MIGVIWLFLGILICLIFLIKQLLPAYLLKMFTVNFCYSGQKYLYLYLKYRLTIRDFLWVSVEEFY